MNASHFVFASLSNEDLLSATWSLVRRSRAPEADLLAHLGEIDDRKLYLDLAFPSMFAFCVGELGLSEDVAYNRIVVARAGRRFPAVIESLRSGKAHLAGLRLLAPHLTDDNHVELLTAAAGKTKREIEEILGRFAPSIVPMPSIRKLPDGSSVVRALMATAPEGARAAQTTDTMYRVQFTVDKGFRDKIRQAQDLLRRRIPHGDLASIFERALDGLIQGLKKERFGSGRNARRTAAVEVITESRHIPDAMKRAVYERDKGRCTFVAKNGRRCGETGGLEFHHLDGFARTHKHSVARIVLRCRPHNQHAADQMYGREFMEQARVGRAAGRVDVDGRLPSG